MKLSIVTTLYKSAAYIEEFYRRVSLEAKNITEDYEIIFVDDGSPDNSLQKTIRIQKEDAKVKVLELSRNFGHHKAILTGLAHARGQFVFLIDSDLEEEPELLGKFWKEMQSNKNIDVVYGVQESRKGNSFEKWSGDLFYSFFNKISDVKVPRNVLTCRLTTQDYNKALTSHKEREVFLAGLWIISGFNQKPLVVKKHSHSETTYSLRHKFSMLFNSLTSFSSFPLKFIFYLGSFISIFSFIFAATIIFKKLFLGVQLEGWSSLIVSLWFLGGIIIFSIGLVGIYISKLFSEVKQRPYTIIRKTYKQ
ncbi:MULTISPECIES: glycosyltransferase family 2 protein [Francisella]|uniref:Glycosyltransferase family 2 protein n=3 Tax=Francisella TaxID=262 RepID=A0AAJ4NNJ8_9GAMM|nr:MULTISPECIES: glycosyltransferase family 2 protein [Francisella]AEI35787.1 Glycosyl transferase, family 2 [Francisella salina]QEO57421.1 glycosyltransferase family 2 protein [Francisella marina]QEO58460.1 glycosyltransferase family 2 protein [Francisella marina]QWU98916.1 glycosyltransferase family 2 protein [Francisella salimarina]